jgi:hypothetical protein
MIAPWIAETAVQKAKIGHTEDLAAIKRLKDQAHRPEWDTGGPSAEALFAEESLPEETRR